MKNQIKSGILSLILSFMGYIGFGQNESGIFHNDKICVGAERFGKYLPLLKGKKIGLVVNQTSTVGKNQTHIVDTLRRLGVQITAIFAPEHGFRGKADAGEKVDNSVDAATGIPIISIYGKKHGPEEADLINVDMLVFDIQDVGTRYYTYIGTLEYVMIAAAEFKKALLVLDRPNPNGHYVDGPILEKENRSFVGMQAIPIVHGMTVAEYAKMLNSEGWLKNKLKCDLHIVKCTGYTHKRFYKLPVKPSPNLPNMHAIYLYTDICFFEGTDVSLGRGTNKQFQVYGSPYYDKSKAKFEFTPMPNEGAKEPPLKGKLCYGHDLSTLKISDLQRKRAIDLSYILDAYQNFEDKSKFFLKTNFIDKLAGTKTFQQQIKDGKTAAEIRATWVAGIQNFKKLRKKYLLYADFE
jgi:uncharacterized protein YbbC (DUF1343 family)